MLGVAVGCWLADGGRVGLIIGLNGGGLVALVVVSGLPWPDVRPEMRLTIGLRLLLAALAVAAAADPTPLATRFITDGLSTFG